MALSRSTWRDSPHADECMYNRRVPCLFMFHDIGELKRKFGKRGVVGNACSIRWFVGLYGIGGSRIEEGFAGPWVCRDVSCSVMVVVCVRMYVENSNIW